jgi:glutamate dehydrogenase/leucine dehydrogenase
VALPEPLGPAELLALECEVLIPSALENAITEQNTYRVKAKVVAEAANSPVTPEADQAFDEKGTFLPRISYVTPASVTGCTPRGSCSPPLSA